MAAVSFVIDCERVQLEEGLDELFWAEDSRALVRHYLLTLLDQNYALRTRIKRLEITQAALIKRVYLDEAPEKGA